MSTPTYTPHQRVILGRAVQARGSIVKPVPAWGCPAAQEYIVKLDIGAHLRVRHDEIRPEPPPRTVVSRVPPPVPGNVFEEEMAAVKGISLGIVLSAAFWTGAIFLLGMWLAS